MTLCNYYQLRNLGGDAFHLDNVDDGFASFISAYVFSSFFSFYSTTAF